MNPPDMFCPYRDCPSHRQPQTTHVVSHSRREQRFKCRQCGRTFVARKGTPYYRVRTPEATVTCVVTLLAHGCPPQAIVAAFGLDERTVSAWQHRAGDHAQQVHAATVCQGEIDLGHVQADELWVKLVQRRLWMALAVAVPSRLWLGGVVGRRDGELIRALVEQVRRCAQHPGILVCVDGLASYVTAFRRAFQEWVATTERRQPFRRLPAGFLLGQVIKRKVEGRLEVDREVVIGSLEEIEARLQATGGGRVINTAFIERLNATFRSRLAPLIRRGRCLARQETTLQSGMYLLGTVYNFCCFHDSLRRLAPAGSGRKWEERTPAMTAGLTDHRWTVGELLHYRVRPKALDWEKWRGKRRKGTPRQGKTVSGPALCLSTV